MRSLDGSSDRDRDRNRDRLGSSSSSNTSQKFSVGDRVEAKCEGWSKYFKGEITRVNGNGTYDIKFDDGERKRGVESTLVRTLIKTSISTDKKLNADVYRGARVEAKVSGWTKYYRGEVIKDNGDQTYDILFEDGDRKYGIRLSQIRPLDGGSGRGVVSPRPSRNTPRERVGLNTLNTNTKSSSSPSRNRKRTGSF